MRVCRLILSLFTAVSLGISAETKSSHNFGDYTVHYSVFNSTMIQPEIASAHQLKRAGNLVYINIAVVNDSDKDSSKKNSYGIAALISGQARNLLQQRRSLHFITIKEQTATYYLAPFYFNNEDIYHFDITVATEKHTSPEIASDS